MNQGKCRKSVVLGSGSELRTVVRNVIAPRIGCLLDQSSRALRREDVEVGDFRSPRSERLSPSGIGPLICRQPSPPHAHTPGPFPPVPKP
eukprot:310920-Chlamydomonas_euryale.AAC.2